MIKNIFIEKHILQMKNISIALQCQESIPKRCKENTLFESVFTKFTQENSGKKALGSKIMLTIASTSAKRKKDHEGYVQLAISAIHKIADNIFSKRSVWNYIKEWKEKGYIKTKILPRTESYNRNCRIGGDDDAFIWIHPDIEANFNKLYDILHNNSGKIGKHARAHFIFSPQTPQANFLFQKTCKYANENKKKFSDLPTCTPHSLKNSSFQSESLILEKSNISRDSKSKKIILESLREKWKKELAAKRNLRQGHWYNPKRKCHMVSFKEGYQIEPDKEFVHYLEIVSRMSYHWRQFHERNFNKYHAVKGSIMTELGAKRAFRAWIMHVLQQRWYEKSEELIKLLDKQFPEIRVCKLQNKEKIMKYPDDLEDYEYKQVPEFKLQPPKYSFANQSELAKMQSKVQAKRDEFNPEPPIADLPDDTNLDEIDWLKACGLK